MVPKQALAVACTALLLAGCWPSEKEDTKTRSATGGASSAPQQQSVVTVQGDSVGEGVVGKGVSLAVAPPLRDRATISVTVVGGTAEPVKDYTLQQGEHEIAAGARSFTLPISVVDDAIFEGDEDVQVQVRILSGNARISGTGNVSVVILDNDERPTLMLPNDLTTVAESVGSIDIPLTISHPASTDLSVNATISGTATAGADYTIENPLVVFLAGTTKAFLNVEILQDRLVEGGETILLDFSSPDGIVPSGALRYSLIISAEALLNDTGMQMYGDGASLSVSPQGPIQDAHHGRDVTHPVNDDGRNGFRFSKLDEHGNTLPLGAPGWTCVRDNVSGLIWEKKDLDMPDLFDLEYGEVPAGTKNYRAADYLYTWYSTNVKNSGGSLGATNDRIFAKNLVDSDGYCAYPVKEGRRHQLYCNTDTYTKEVNWFGLCGSKQWRVPGIEELRSIVDYELVEVEGNGLDSRFFPNNKRRTYLSGTPTAEFDASAWCLDMGSGEVELCHKGAKTSVRLVAEGQGE